MQRTGWDAVADSFFLSTRNWKRKWRNHEGQARQAPEQKADRMTENVGKKGNEARERNWRKPREEFKKALKHVKKIEKNYELSGKDREALGGKPEDKQNFWSVWGVAVTTADCTEFVVNCSGPPVCVLLLRAPSLPWEASPGSQDQDPCVSVLVQSLTLTSSLIHLRHSSRRDESDHEVTGRGRSRGKARTSLLLIAQEKILHSPYTHTQCAGDPVTEL